MLFRLSPFLRILHPPLPADAMAARISRALPASFAFGSHRSSLLSPISSSIRLHVSFPALDSLVFGRRSNALGCGDGRNSRGLVKVFASQRGYRKVRWRQAKSKQKELELSVKICIEEQLPDDPEILDIAEMLRLNVPMGMKLAFDGLKHSEYKTRDNAIDDVGHFDTVELSVLLCNDEFIRKLNKDWRDEDHATDVLSMSQHIPDLKLPILMLGDIVISVETAARQAQEREHTLLDEIRILLVHGLLHLLGFDHEISDEAEAEMEKEENDLLKSLGWKGKGLIQSACDADTNGSHHEISDEAEAEMEKEENHLLKSLGWKGKGLIQSAFDADTNGSPHMDIPDDRKKEGSLRFYRPKFRYIFCDMDGTLLNNKSQITLATAKALREASSRGLKVVIATGKTRPAVISCLKTVDLAGNNGIISELSPGVFLQGLLVYGRQGREIFRRNLDPNVCREAFHYSLEHSVPLIAFSEDRCLTLFDHPLVDSLHTVYHEPKAEILPSVELLLAGVDIQKLIFLDTVEGVATTLRPFWSEATSGRATVVQAVPDMLEIIPSGSSKGSGVRMLLDHLGVTAQEIMAIGDGENDVEMLELASLGIALGNGSEKAKAVADVIGASNDDDGVADAIYRYAF